MFQVVNCVLMLIITGWRSGPLFGNLDAHGRLLVAHDVRQVQVGTEMQSIWFTQATPAVPAVPAAPAGPGGLAAQLAVAAVPAASAKRVNFTSAQIGGRSERLFDALGLFELCDHTWRVSFCVWAAQCGGLLLSVIATGFWNPEMSAEWHKYFSKGLQRQHRYTHSGTVDPLMRVFPYDEDGMVVKDLSLDPSDMVAPVFPL